MVLAAILLAAAALRLAALDKPLYIDEIVTITVARQPIDRMAAVMRQIDASPALFPLLLHGWLYISHADAWVRTLPAIFGLLVVLVVYLLGRRLFGEWSGLAAGWVAAVAPAHVHYAQYVRSYSLFTLLAGLQLLLLLAWFEVRVPEDGADMRAEASGASGQQGAPRATAGTERLKRRWQIVGVTLLTAALFYTHYLSLLLLLPEAVWAALRFRRKRRAVTGWAASMAVALALFAPGVPLLLHNMTFDRVRNEARAQPPALLHLVPDLVAELSLGQRALGFGDPAVRRATLAGAAVIFPLLALVGATGGWRERRSGTLLMLLTAVLPVAAYVLSGRRLVAVRFFLPFMVAYLVLLGHGLASIRGRLQVLAALALTAICAIPLAHFFVRYQWSYDHRAVAREIAARLGPGDVILFVHPYEAFYYRWYLGDGVPMKGLVFTALEDQGTYVIKPQALTFETAWLRVVGAARDHDRFWVIGQSRRSFASDAQEERRLLAVLDVAFVRRDDLSLITGSDPVVRLYERRPEAAHAPVMPRD